MALMSCRISLTTLINSGRPNSKNYRHFSITNQKHSSMKGQGYTATIEVGNAPQDVFDHIMEVSKWWSKDFEGNSANLNGEFVICHPGRHYSKQKLVELIPGERIVWLVTESELDWLENDKHEWTNTRMVFEITTKNSNTVLHFTHEGLVP